MKLRTKAILFFGTFIFAIAIGISFYVENVVGNIFKKQTTDNFRIIAEQSEGAYISFLESVKVRVLDWTSDSTIRNTARAILSAPSSSPERSRLAKEFAVYVSNKKMPYDKTIFLVDLLDKNGTIVASTRAGRIGNEEKLEEKDSYKAHNFDSAINSKFSEVFFGGIVLKENENPEPTMNATVRFFDIGNNGEMKPMDAVLLVYFSNMRQIADVIGSGVSSMKDRLTGKAVLESYKTSDIYLVNNEGIMVTPSRDLKDIKSKQKVDTLPVRECLEKGKEVNEEYDNYQGIRVLGASMCFKDNGVTLVVEIHKDEIFAPLSALIRSTLVGGAIVIIFYIFLVIFFARRPLARINDIVTVAKRVTSGDLDAHVEVRTKDEVGYLGATVNNMITAIRDAEKELRATKYKAEEESIKDEALLASIGEGMIATDNNGLIIKINNAAEKMLGLKSADVIGKKLVDAVEALDENNVEIPDGQRIVNSALKGASVTSNTMQYKRENDGYFPIALTWTPVMLEGNVVGAIGIFRDTTREKEIEKTRGDLLSLASHQLRTPLSGTKWLIETLKKGIHGPLTAGQTEYIDELYKINERMTELVHDMLGVLRLEGGSTKTKVDDISTKVLLASVFETMRGVAESKNIQLHIQKDVDYTANTDPILLRNILESFVGNAINYSESGREVAVWVEQKPSELVFVVRDSGIGIPREEQQQIFERFYRASNAKTFDTRGSGLGLYIASMLAKKLGAHLSFESEEGKGSTFYVHLPATAPGVLPGNTTSV